MLFPVWDDIELKLSPTEQKLNLTEPGHQRKRRRETEHAVGAVPLGRLGRPAGSRMPRMRGCAWGGQGQRLASQVHEGAENTQDTQQPAHLGLGHLMRRYLDRLTVRPR